MRKKIFVLVFVFLVASLLAACQPQVTKEDVEAIAANAAAQAVAGVPTPEIPEVLTQEEVEAIAANAAAQAVAEIPAPEVPESLTEEQVAGIIADALAARDVEIQEALSQFVVPISWFADNNTIFKNGLTVAWECERGARAWQGELGFSVVPQDERIDVVEVNCVQYDSGEEIPQSELLLAKGVGTIWFLLPIEGTENQLGDCPCLDGDC